MTDINHRTLTVQLNNCTERQRDHIANAINRIVEENKSLMNFCYDSNRDYVFTDGDGEFLPDPDYSEPDSDDRLFEYTDGGDPCIMSLHELTSVGDGDCELYGEKQWEIEALDVGEYVSMQSFYDDSVIYLKRIK